jgi:outer membrane protein OmpA-like peptidoglycan-associated protein
LRTGKVAAKKVAFAQAADVDAAPTQFFADSPAWSPDPHIQAYIDACQKSKVGDSISPLYLDGIVAAAQVNQATIAYDAGHYRDALDLYQTAVVSPAGDQLRIYNGIYLSSERLGDHAQAERAFGNLVDYGLRHNRLGVKLLFQPGSAGFVSDPRISGNYDMWLQEIASHAAQGPACLLVTGNTSASGLPALNDRLSLARAEFVDRRLVEYAPSLAGRITPKGAGSHNNLIGTGRDDATDALDRRVDFAIAPAC